MALLIRLLSFFSLLDLTHENLFEPYSLSERNRSLNFANFLISALLQNGNRQLSRLDFVLPLESNLVVVVRGTNLLDCLAVLIQRVNTLR